MVRLDELVRQTLASPIDYLTSAVVGDFVTLMVLSFLSWVISVIGGQVAGDLDPLRESLVVQWFSSGPVWCSSLVIQWFSGSVVQWFSGPVFRCSRPHEL